jgi:trigger factor
VRATVEPVEGTGSEDATEAGPSPQLVRVAVEVDEADLEPAIAEAWRQIAKEVRLPGFRPGKAPRRLLEQQLGSGYGRSEALRTALPEFYSRAVIEHDVDVIAPPELDITSGQESGPVTFHAVVEVRPQITVAGYDGLRVEVPSPEIPEAEVDEQIDRFRAQYGELTPVERPAAEGDYVTIDLHGTRDGQEVEGLSADDYLYLVGSGLITPAFDEHLRGASVGDVLEFESPHPDPEQDPVTFRVLVKEVQERVLPDLTDEWVADATEFDTVEAFRDDVRARLSQAREAQTRASVRARIGAELARLVDEAVPHALVSTELEGRVQNLVLQLQGRGISLEDYLRITGRDAESFTAELRSAAEEAVKVDLALRAVARAEGLEASDDEVDEEIARMIRDLDVDLETAKEQLRTSGQLSAVRSEVSKRKALEWLVEHSEVVDPDGQPIPEEYLSMPDHEHDHDHDH